MKKQSGITLISLVITIALLLIIAGTTVYTSVDRFKINNLQKMYNDIELLEDKVENYHLKYGGLPVVKDADNNPVSYTYTILDFNKDANDNDNYYIIDLSAIGDITLNYGEEGYQNQNASDDVYIINEATHIIYYVRGIESSDGNVYHSKKVDGNVSEDTVPPTKPEVNIISKIFNGDESYAEVEIIPGRDNDSGVKKTEYTISKQNVVIETREISDRVTITLDETATIKVSTVDNNNNITETSKNIAIPKMVDYIKTTGTQYIKTDFVPNSNTSIEMKLSNLSSGGETVCLYCARTALYTDTYSAFLINGINLRVDYNNKSNANLYTAELNKPYIYKQDKNVIYVDGEMVKTIDEIQYNCDYQLYLLSSHLKEASSGLNVSKNANLYYCKIWDNGTLVRDYIPVIDENGVACLYDKINDKFYYNAGSGNFTTNLDE